MSETLIHAPTPSPALAHSDPSPLPSMASDPPQHVGPLKLNVDDTPVSVSGMGFNTPQLPMVLGATSSTWLHSTLLSHSARHCSKL